MNKESIVSLKVAEELFLVDRQSQALSKSTVHFYQDRVGKFVKWCMSQGVETLDQLTPVVVRSYVAFRMNQGIGKYTLHTDCRGIRTFLKWCMAEELVQSNPLRNVKIPKQPKEVLPAISPEDIQRLLAVAPDERATALVLFLLDTGLRVGELVRLNGEDVDLGNGTVLVRRSKTGRSRIAFLSETTRKAMEDYFNADGWPEAADPVWRNTYKNYRSRLDSNRMRVGSVQVVLRKMAAIAKVKGASPHSFRRTFALFSLRAGVDIHTLARLMGHSDIDILKQYLALNDNDTAMAHKKADIVARYLK